VFLSIFTGPQLCSGSHQYRGNDGSEGSESYLDKDVNDVLNIMALARSLPYVDSDRMGILGFPAAQRDLPAVETASRYQSRLCDGLRHGFRGCLSAIAPLPAFS